MKKIFGVLFAGLLFAQTCQASSILDIDSGGVSAGEELSLSDSTINDFSLAKHGFAPKGTSTSEKYLRGDATWQTPLSGSGDVIGPSSSIDSEIPIYDSTTGKLIKRFAGTGIIKATSGVIGTATAGTDYLTPSGSGASLTGITPTQIGLGNVANVDTTTTANITDSTNKRFVTNANLTTIGNQSGTNTGDNAANSQYSGLAASKADVAGSASQDFNTRSLFGSQYIQANKGIIAPIKLANMSKGALGSIATAIASGTNPWDVSGDPTGRFVYVSNITDSTVSQYSINQTTGVLSSITTAIASGTSPRGVSCDSTGRFFYAVNYTDFTVSQYSINQTTGALSSITTAIASGTSPISISCDPTGRFAYVSNYGGATISQYSINQTTGALSSITTAIASGTGPRGSSCDPTGRFFYAVNFASSTVSQYSIDQTTGALSSITTAIASGTNPRDISCDPTGRFAYVPNITDSTVSQYSINQTTGALSSITTAIASGTSPVSISCDPTGRFAYVSNYGGATISQYSINQTTGELSSIATAIASGTNPINISCDPTGRFFYVVNYTDSTISQYAINSLYDGRFSFVPAQTKVTSTRALNTTYTNSSDKSIQVLATVRCVITSVGGNAYVQGKSDASTPPTTIASGKAGIEAGLLNEDNSIQLSFVVAPGMKFRIDSATTNGTCTLGEWFEIAY